jgi:release factor glutamine methyltransferase
VLAAALARELGAAAVWASDIEAGALAVARANLARHAPGVRLVRSDRLAAFRGRKVDLVVSNPPYVAEAEIAGLAPEVRNHEPRVALAAGADGLLVLRALVAEAPRVLAAGGWLVVEMGAGQAAAVRRLVEETGRYARVEVVRDHAGIERVLAAREGRGAWTRS